MSVPVNNMCVILINLHICDLRSATYNHKHRFLQSASKKQYMRWLLQQRSLLADHTIPAQQGAGILSEKPHAITVQTKALKFTGLGA